MPDVRTFRAASMRDALAAVRADLGADAVILKTRQVPAKRKLFGLKRPADQYEITAGLGIEPTRPPKVKSNIDPSAAPAHRFREELAPPPELPSRGPAMTVAERKAAEIVRELTQRDLPSPLTSPDALRDALETTRAVTSRTPTLTPRPVHATSLDVADPDPGDLLAMKLDLLGRQIERLERPAVVVPPADMPDTVRPVFNRLVAADVEPTLAAELVDGLETRDAAGHEPIVAARIAETLSCAGELPVGSSRPYVAAVVGPTGVGKTTTVAKLAARYAFERGHRVGLVTVDTQRIGAIDQLRSYAEVMRLPLEVVSTADEFPAALGRLSDCELTLVDTAGRSPRDEAGVAKLARLLGAADVDEVMLTLGLSSSLRSAAAAVERFRPLAASSLIVTKLDEADGPGPLPGVARRASLPLRYVTDGQEVPGDIAAADAADLARRLLAETASGVGT